MEDLETRIAAAEALLEHKETYRYLESNGIRVTERLLNFLSCIACKTAQDQIATVGTITGSGCVGIKSAYNIGQRLSEQRIIIRSGIPRPGLPGKPCYGLSLRDFPDAVTEELLTHRPCENQAD